MLQEVYTCCLNNNIVFVHTGQHFKPKTSDDHVLKLSKMTFKRCCFAVSFLWQGKVYFISVKTQSNDFKFPGRCFTMGRMAAARELQWVSDWDCSERLICLVNVANFARLLLKNTNIKLLWKLSSHDLILLHLQHRIKGMCTVWIVKEKTPFFMCMCFYTFYLTANIQTVVISLTTTIFQRDFMTFLG